MNVLDLFSGIGGFSLGLERAGMRTAAFCEINPFCRAVLARWWPDVPCYDDVRTLAAGPGCNAICAGFPCQDASIANTGNRVGIEGERTGLWREVRRLASDIRPEFVLLENVPGLLSVGFGRVLGDLAEIGFDAEWRCITASAAGLPHRRERLWIVCYPRGSRLSRYIGGKSLLESVDASLAQLGDAAARSWRALDGVIDGIRSHDGLPVGVHRHRVQAAGNAIVPVIAEAIGREIVRRL